MRRRQRRCDLLQDLTLDERVGRRAHALRLPLLLRISKALQTLRDIIISISFLLVKVVLPVRFVVRGYTAIFIET